MNHLIGIAVVAAALGCTTEPKVLVFGQSQNVGLSVGGSAPEQRAEITLGYKDYNIAVIPTSVLSKAPDANGEWEDSLSVLGQFELDAEAGTENSVGLGKFFATGGAARTLADGFRCKVSDGKHETCTQH